MANANEFIVPEFIKEQSVEEILKRIISNFPEDIDLSEGSDDWDRAYAVAYELSYISQYILLEAIKQIWPQFSYGDYALYHAEGRNITLKAATFAHGELLITGTPNTVIYQDTKFATVALEGAPSMYFTTTEDVVIDSEGTVLAPIQAVTAGRSGNVPANTIILKVDRNDDIKSVTNPEKLIDGTDRETLNSLIDRIVKYDREQGASYIGNNADYIRWAMEVPGVGGASVIPAQPINEKGESDGKVTIIIVDANNEPFEEGSQIFKDVYDHIMRDDDTLKRLAPTTDMLLDVKSPEIEYISISATVELDGTASMESIKSLYTSILKTYFVDCLSTGEVKYKDCYSKLSGVAGVNDYKDFTVTADGIETNGYQNIKIGTGKLPKLKTLTLTEGVV